MKMKSKNNQYQGYCIAEDPFYNYPEECLVHIDSSTLIEPDDYYGKNNKVNISKNTENTKYKKENKNGNNQEK